MGPGGHGIGDMLGLWWILAKFENWGQMEKREDCLRSALVSECVGMAGHMRQNMMDFNSLMPRSMSQPHLGCRVTDVTEPQRQGIMLIVSLLSTVTLQRMVQG